MGCRRNDELCVTNSKTIKEYAERFPRGHWSFLGSGSEKKWYGTYDYKPDGSWNRTPEKMLQNFKDSGHTIFLFTSALERGQLRSKGGGKTTIHFNGSTENIELLLQVVIYVSSVFLRSSGGCDWRITSWSESSGETAASCQLDKQEIITQPPLAEVQANEERQGNLLQENEQRFEKMSEDQKLSRLCSEAGLRLVEIGLCSPVTKRRRKSIFVPRKYVASRSRRNSFKSMDPKQCTIWPSLGHKNFQSIWKIQYWSSSSIFVSRSNRILD